MIEPDKPTSYALGMDIGGTNLRAGLYALPQDTLHMVPTPHSSLKEKVGDDRSPEALCARIVTVVERLVQEAGLHETAVDATSIPLGVAFAGMLSGHRGHVANSPHFGWRDVPFGDLLRTSFTANRPIQVLNDVNAATFAEYRAPGTGSSEDILTLFVGTGIGAGAVCGGQLLTGSRNTATELGHVKVTFGSDACPCACGRHGCVEAYAGGVAIQNRVRRELSNGQSSLVVSLANGAEHIHPGHIDQAAAQGDQYALSLYSEIAPLLGLSAANAVTLLNPGVLILGGGVLDNAPILKAQMLQHFHQFVNPPALEGLQIRDASLGDDAGMLGAALFAVRSS